MLAVSPYSFFARTGLLFVCLLITACYWGPRAGFDRHISRFHGDHNMWNYAFFIIHILVCAYENPPADAPKARLLRVVPFAFGG